jgi:ABC-2 type transport system ATP-binding protein
MTEPLVVDVHGLSKRYGQKLVVDGIDLHIPKGKIFGFLGPNGSGKTTTIRMICGLLTPDAGRGTCLGFDLLKQPNLIKQRVGYMTQKFSFWEDLTVRENLLFVADMFGLDRAKERVETSLNKMDLMPRADQLAGALSGGWKQRLALGACILHEPELLLLDEPTAGVDPRARREFWDEIHRLAAQGLTVLVSTHYMDEAERCHSIIYISNGRLVVEGTVDEVVSKAGLTTWSAHGDNLVGLMEKLKAHPAVTTVAAFGGALHVSGTNALALKKALAPFKKDARVTWTQEQPSLEDAFIYYMARNKDSGGS